MKELTSGIYRWTAPHPEWRPAHPWGHEVASYAIEAPGATVLVDPLVPVDGPNELWTSLDRLVTDRGEPLAVMITIHYHVRSAAAMLGRYDNRLPVTIWAHRAVEKRLPRGTRLESIEPGAPLPAGAQAFAIGSPRRQEQPLYFPSHKALAFGDSLVGVDGAIRVWESVRGERRERWYRDRFLPTLEPLLQLDVEHVLPTHGPAVIGGGAQALARALADDPWTTRSS